MSQRAPAPPRPEGVLKALPVPPAHKPSTTPLVRLLMPVVMVSAMAAMVIVMFLSAGAINPMMLVMPLMAAMGFLMMFSPQAANDVDETRRTYLRHLGQLRATALSNARAQRDHQAHCYPDPGDLWALVGGERMWEKTAQDEDYLEARVGVGSSALCTPIDVGDPGASEDLDPVCAMALRHTVRAVSTVPDSPVVVQLRAFPYVSVAGVRAAECVRALLSGLAFHHGPEALGIIADPQGREWEWLKWLPHTRAPQKAAYVIAVVDGDEEAPQADTVVEIARGGPPSVLRHRAQEEGLALDVGEDEGMWVHTVGGKELLGAPDLMTVPQAAAFARRIAPYYRADAALAGMDPARSNDLLDLLRMRGREDLAIDRLWPGRQADPGSRLKVPIGVSTETGSPVWLDLKESAHGGMGPHGLCIGATGSGKSELLRTLVAALAATHSPEELSLILVDFKGGATFLGLDHLPHTSAVITNLEQEAILVERMQDAIAGEMNRRQEALREAGNFANVLDYEAARAAGRTDLEPMPALLIVVDEFSELLGQHPDFADLFVAVGRLGRSLHVHLLLASQRLEEGRLRGLDSHLSYRIGLRTFSAAESRQVLGVPDAHELPAVPGMGFLKAGAEDVRGFRAAYVSGPLISRRDAEASRAGVRRYQSWDDVEKEVVEVVEEGSGTVLEAVVDSARAAARQRGHQARTVWLPPLPDMVELAGVVEPMGNLKAAVGIIDRPYRQRQDPLVVDFRVGGGHVALCGGPRSGKSTALQSIVASLAATHTTDQVRFYVVDMGGENHEVLSRLPHVAGVAHKKDLGRVHRVFDEVTALVEEAIPEEGRHTFVVIDGWHALVTDCEDEVERVERIVADGAAAGVHVMISTQRWTVLRPAIRDLIDVRLELQLGEAMDSLIDRKAQQKIPARPGRGITQDGEQMLWCRCSTQDIAHIAMVSAEQNPVPRLKVFPTDLSLADLPHVEESVTVGIGGIHLDPVSWRTDHLLCVGARGSGKSTLVRTVLAGLVRRDPRQARIVMVDHRRAHLGAVPEEMLAAYSASSTITEEALRSTAVTLRERIPGPEVSPEQLRSRSWWEGPEIYVVIDDADLVEASALSHIIALLPHARDVGLRLVVAHKSGGINRAMYQPFLAALRDQIPAVLLLDADREEGAVCGMKPVAQPPGRGRWLDQGADPITIQVARTESSGALSCHAGTMRVTGEGEEKPWG
ncbi:type VII secretion protein EccCa [Corynebacterium sp. zg-331]|nr:type VII secretion protein EccCa [Corynebacterium sp. zg-331]MPV52496.1 type VII secretion protein EccCa [Corynebacterium sp. zg331]